MGRTLLLITALVLAACGSKDGDKPAASGSAGSATASSKSDPADDMAAKHPPGPRPASVSPEMAESFELYIAAFEKMMTDLAAAGTDCKAALAAVERNTAEIEKLKDRGDKLTESMKAAKGDKSAGEWFGATFAPRLQKASGKMAPVMGACESDKPLHEALDNAMSKFPMMRKKS